VSRTGFWKASLVPITVYRESHVRGSNRGKLTVCDKGQGEAFYVVKSPVSSVGFTILFFFPLQAIFSGRQPPMSFLKTHQCNQLLRTWNAPASSSSSSSLPCGLP
jgi:hypothetical protein